MADDRDIATEHGWRALVGRIARATRHPDKAEDYLHSAYLRLEDYRRQVRVDNPAAFLVRAAVNLSRDELRHDRVRSESGQNIHDLIDISDTRPLQYEVIATRRRLERVKAGLDRLSPRTRQIFLMHRIEGLKYRVIAEKLGITISAVEKHIAKAALFLTEWAQDW